MEPLNYTLKSSLETKSSVPPPNNSLVRERLAVTLLQVGSVWKTEYQLHPSEGQSLLMVMGIVSVLNWTATRMTLEEKRFFSRKKQQPYGQ